MRSHHEEWNDRMSHVFIGGRGVSTEYLALGAIGGHFAADPTS
jgi:hypothetical protein